MLQKFVNFDVASFVYTTTRFAELRSSLVLRNPITGIFGCYTRAAIGNATAAPPRSVMNSRRFMSAPGSRHGIVSAQTGALEGTWTDFVQLLRKAGSMSALGRTYAVRKGMSALPPKADICAPSAMSAAAMPRWPAGQARKRCIEAIKGSQAAT